MKQKRIEGLVVAMDNGQSCVHLNELDPAYLTPGDIIEVNHWQARVVSINCENRFGWLGGSRVVTSREIEVIVDKLDEVDDKNADIWDGIEPEIIMVDDDYIRQCGYQLPGDPGHVYIESIDPRGENTFDPALGELASLPNDEDTYTIDIDGMTVPFKRLTAGDMYDPMGQLKTSLPDVQWSTNGIDMAEQYLDERGTVCVNSDAVLGDEDAAAFGEDATEPSLECTGIGPDTTKGKEVTFTRGNGSEVVVFVTWKEIGAAPSQSAQVAAENKLRAEMKKVGLI